MAKSIQDINNELTAYQCCIANLTIEYITKEIYGQQDIECLYNRLVYGVLLIENLKSPQEVMDLNYLTQAELELELEKLNNLCGCMNCPQGLASITDDTISTGLDDLLIY